MGYWGCKWLAIKKHAEKLQYRQCAHQLFEVHVHTVFYSQGWHLFELLWLTNLSTMTVPYHVDYESFGTTFELKVLSVLFLFLDFLGKEGAPSWRKNWLWQWQGFRLDLCVSLFFSSNTYLASWHETNPILFWFCSVWTFDTETECWSVVEAKGDIPVLSFNLLYVLLCIYTYIPLELALELMQLCHWNKFPFHALHRYLIT